MIRIPFLLVLLGLAIGAFLAVNGTAMAAERVTWEDLAPPFDESKNPLYGLGPEQQGSLNDLILTRSLRSEFGEDSHLSEEERAARRRLQESGLDPDVLLGQVDAFNRHIADWNETLVEELDGQEIEIAGYVLPLEFSGTAVTEFLLVPYVGACIHVPPPPTNQMVHVRTAEGFESEGLYAPVWVTGQISNRPQSLSLSLVDGSDNVSVGYGLEAAKIEPYK